MSSIFNFKRFTAYLRHDLAGAWRKAGASVISIACLPVWFFVIYQLFCLVFDGKFGYMHYGAGVVAYAVSFILAAVFFPVQIYGKLTDKRQGSNWLLLPASAFEKFLSMLLVLCVALPLVWLALIVASDYLLSLTNLYDGPAIRKIFDGLGSVLAEIHTENVSLAFGSRYGLYLNWCANILFFALGALLFRKNKIVYTFLSLMGIGILITMAAGLAASVGDFSMHISPEDVTEDSLMHTINGVLYALYVIEFALLDLGIFFRIKSLKH